MRKTLPREAGKKERRITAMMNTLKKTPWDYHGAQQHNCWGDPIGEGHRPESRGVASSP